MPAGLKNIIAPANTYHPVDDLWIISCFYNSNQYTTKPKNFELFIEKIESSGLHYLVVECAFGKQPFSLKKSANIIRVKTKDIMWQKERLLNIALEHLPAKCRKVAWIDCDVLFENENWAVETSEKLNRYKVVQPYQTAIRLPKDAVQYEGTGDAYYSFGYIVSKNPTLVAKGKFDLHGHTGFAWAAQKSVMQKIKFYDVCIAGTADHLMAHSFAGDWDSECITRFFKMNSHFNRHYVEWSKKIFPFVNSSISYTEGALLHLWHGDRKDRRYIERQQKLDSFGFNPYHDITLNNSLCWQWNHNNKELKEWAEEYFVLRKED